MSTPHNEESNEQHDMVRMYREYDRDHDELRERLMAALPDEPPARATWERRPFVRRAAALLLAAGGMIAVIAVLFSEGQHDVFASALDYLRSVDTFVCRMTTTADVEFQETRGASSEPKKTTFVQTDTVTLSVGIGGRRDTLEDGDLVATYYMPEDEAITIVDHRQKRYQALEITQDGLWGDARTQPDLPPMNLLAMSGDPNRLLHGFRALKADADRDLGLAVFDGRELRGFEISGAKVGLAPPFVDEAHGNRAELWIDDESGVPARLVFHFGRDRGPGPSGRNISYSMTMVYDRFEWNPTLPSGWLDPPIGDGYEEIDMIVPPSLWVPDEAALVAALRAFHDVAGRYPSSLNAMDVAQEVAMTLTVVSSKDGKTSPPAVELSRTFQGLTLYVYLEMTGREPEYFGRTVKADDADAVLLSWKLEDGHTRVLYGDLRAETQ